MPSARRMRRAGVAGKSWPTRRLPRIFASWAGGRLSVIDSRQPAVGIVSTAGCLLLSCGGTSEHPEELTDRCCLSALAGLSKYLPLLGAGGIIALRSDMSTLVHVR